MIFTTYMFILLIYYILYNTNIIISKEIQVTLYICIYMKLFF